MADETSYGWAGKILRVNLSTGSITTQPTDPYKEYIGGMGLANKIMYDEVPAGTDPFSPENKLIFAVGPLTASGVPLAGRTTICSLSTFTKDHLVVDAHCGGMIGAKIKLAGWDAVVLEGASDHPVYLNIVDDKVEIKDAGFVWGMGTRETTEMLCRKEGVEACVAAIGPAGGLGRGGLRSLIEIPGDYLPVYPFAFQSIRLHGLDRIVDALGGLLAVRGEALDPGGAVPDEGLDGFGVVRHEPGGEPVGVHARSVLEPVEAVEARAVPAVVEPEGGHVVQRDPAEELEELAREPTAVKAGEHVQQVAVIGRVGVECIRAPVVPDR